VFITNKKTCHIASSQFIITLLDFVFFFIYLLANQNTCNYIRKFGDYLLHSALEQRLSVFVDLASEQWQTVRIEMSFGMEVSFSQSYVVLVTHSVYILCSSL